MLNPYLQDIIYKSAAAEAAEEAVRLSRLRRAAGFAGSLPGRGYRRTASAANRAWNGPVLEEGQTARFYQRPGVRRGAIIGTGTGLAGGGGYVAVRRRRSQG